MNIALASETLPVHRVPLRRLGCGRITAAYGGRFEAWSFTPTTDEQWFREFRERLLASMGRTYLPVYRMADGEFRFLLGRRVRWQSEHPLRDVLAVAAERLGLTHRTARTSWGEHYGRSESRALREKLTNDIRTIATQGYLAVFLGDVGLGTAHEYRQPYCKFVAAMRIPFNSSNYVPFHFVCEALSGPGWEELLRHRRILVATGLDGKNSEAIRDTLHALGARDVQFVGISPDRSMLDSVDTSAVRQPVDLSLVAAGIGAANILVQLQGLKTVVLDIGGYLHCLEDSAFVAHGAFRAPAVTRV
jgi:hypothetical protein